MRFLVCALLLLPVALQAVVIGQVDTFQDLTTAGWTAGGGPVGAVPPIPPQVIPTGGPAGAGDAFLLLTAIGGDGPGSRLTGFNPLGQWAGNYLAAGVTGIAMDLRNASSVDLEIHLLFEDPIPGPPANEALTQGIFLPAGGGWTTAFFPISTSSLTALQGAPQDALENTRVLRIVHIRQNASGSYQLPPGAVVATLSIDNIRATPEPAAWTLAGLSLAAVALRKRRASRAA